MRRRTLAPTVLRERTPGERLAYLEGREAEAVGRVKALRAELNFAIMRRKIARGLVKSARLDRLAGARSPGDHTEDGTHG